jgi:ferredoxin
MDLMNQLVLKWPHMTYPRPFMFHRTSTYRVLEFLLRYEIKSFDELVTIFQKEGHKRQRSDIRIMLNQLIKLDLIDNWKVVKPFNDLEYIDPLIQDKFVLSQMVQMVEYLQKKNLMVIPFLEAVAEAPKKRGLICAKAHEFCKNYGYYHVRVDKDDNVPAMKNFLAFMGLMEKGKGKYKLSVLGQEVVNTYRHSDKNILQRAQCSREYCREICPADVIGAFEITNDCIQCGLCVKACPYGGIGQNDYYNINSSICSSNSGIRRRTKAGPIGMLTSQEDIFQEWLVSLFQLGEWKATIPGVGPFIDLVVFNRPIWIECKISNMTKRSLDKVNNQIQRYQTIESINKTLEQVGKHNKIKLSHPQLFLLCAPEKSDIQSFLSKTSNFDIPTGFISIEALHRVSDYLVQSNTLHWEKLFPKEYSNKDYSQEIIYYIEN